MAENTLKQFRKELDSFILIGSLNMAFGALAMALGMQYIVIMILGLPIWQVPIPWRIPVAAFFMVCIGLGFGWIRSSVRILRGVKSVRKEYRSRNGPVPDEILTCWIIRILSHYRENRPLVRWMVPISITGGCAFLALGASNLIHGIGEMAMGGGLFALAAAVINLTIGCASIACALYFRRYSAAWDERIETAARSENALQCALERR